MRDGTEGVCVRMSSCKAEEDKLKNFVFPKFCSYNLLKPTVCCSDCYSLEYSIRKSQKYSGDQYDNDVAGGVDARRTDYPHMALLGYGETPETAEWMCGGSIISERYILTAAHCISSPTVGKITFAALGILKRTDDFHMWQIYDIIEIIPYPQYNPPSKYHDIALLHTGRRIRFNKEVAAACLNRNNDMPQRAIVTGWGSLGHNRHIADNLQVVQVDHFPDAQCSRDYPVHRLLKRGYDRNTQACYGDRRKVADTCEGDSGGPLQTGVYNDHCKFLIAGITSYGKACGFAGNAGIYTRVSHYMPWIESITGRLL
ncbi:hypothetical protein B5X24_HaOG216496 [Helicoverpa armigera]|nr:hypothetical protein B5X24_HaOG216496 [Helicoverpa armigera]